MKLSTLWKPALAVAGLCTIALPAKADGGVQIVQYRCDPKAHKMYVATSVSYAITDNFDKDIIPIVPNFPEDHKKMECQLSSTDKANVAIFAAPPDKDGSNVTIALNGVPLAFLTFSTEHDDAITIDKYGDKKIQINYLKKTISGKGWEWNPNDKSGFISTAE